LAPTVPNSPLASPLDVVSTAALYSCDIASFGEHEQAQVQKGLAAALLVEASSVRILHSKALNASFGGWLYGHPLDREVRFSVAAPSDYALKEYSLHLHEVTTSGRLKQSLSAHGISCQALHGKHVIRQSSRLSKSTRGAPALS
jgi:hypothetical protein